MQADENLGTQKLYDKIEVTLNEVWKAFIKKEENKSTDDQKKNHSLPEWMSRTFLSQQLPSPN